MVCTQVIVAALALQLAFSVVAREDGESHEAGKAGTDVAKGLPSNSRQGDLYSMPSYAGLSEHSGMMMAHIILMVIAWVFVLPIGVVFSIARIRLALLIQLMFLVSNGLAVVCGIIYNANTSDMYKNNVHHSIGWIATWVMTVQVVMGLLFIYPRRSKKGGSAATERDAFLPVSVVNMAQRDRTPDIDCHWSGDIGPSPECSSIYNGTDVLPMDPYPLDEVLKKPEPEDGDDEPETLVPRCPSFLHIRLFDKYLLARIPRMLPTELLKMLEVFYKIVDRAILILGFIALVTGGVTYAGIFHGNHIFNGLAHFIKGGIFFWYGLLTLGRWMGCFADFGWAWNAKPSRYEVGHRTASVPSAELIESFVIFLYGITNVFLEHLAAWGDAWRAQDLEHVSISIMFFGGGLCGMLVESKIIRKWLNFTVESMAARDNANPAQNTDIRKPPKIYNFSTNPIPALVILLLGIMMSSHHQPSVVSTTVHKQWGTLLSGFSMARMLTYVVIYISPPTSIYPSRPPTELVSSFCLISGGIVFMASTRDIVDWIEAKNLMATFVFTVTMGFTAFIMAYEILVLALKGWAARRKLRESSKVARFGYSAPFNSNHRRSAGGRADVAGQNLH